MGVRAVAVAVALACCALTAQAAQYTEVWNPPEAAHAAKKGKGHKAAPAAKTVVAKDKRQQGAPLKPVSAHAAREAKPRVAPQTASQARLAIAGVSSKSAHARTVKVARSKGAPNKPVKTAHSGNGQHVQMAAVHSKATQQGQQKLAAKPASMRPAPATASVEPKPAPAQPVATMADTAARPVSQSSNLPPILH